MDLQDRVPPEELKRRATGVLLLAFAADPMTRWTWRDPARYLAAFPEFAMAFGGRAFEHGSRLMRRALETADRDGRLAYLESANPKNVPFYQRLGFELLGTIEAGSSPPMFPMLRRPAQRAR